MLRTPLAFDILVTFLQSTAVHVQHARQLALTMPAHVSTHATCATTSRKQKLLGSDTDGQDAFGHSVSIDEDHELLVVGAPYAEDNGVVEVNVK